MQTMTKSGQVTRENGPKNVVVFLEKKITNGQDSHNNI